MTKKKKKPGPPGSTQSRPPVSKRHGYEAKTRNCLRCGREFLSQWFGNRICKECRISRASLEGF